MSVLYPSNTLFPDAVVAFDAMASTTAFKPLTSITADGYFTYVDVQWDSSGNFVSGVADACNGLTMADIRVSTSTECYAVDYGYSTTTLDYIAPDLSMLWVSIAVALWVGVFLFVYRITRDFTD